LENLRDAVTLAPRIKEAVVELVDVALQQGKLEEAGKWIGVAEKENISPAKIAFLKGLLLKEEGKNLEAVEAFEKAKSADPSITQAADVQIALCFLAEKDLKKAKDRFQIAILHDPQSDLAGFARQYMDLLEDRIFLERPFRFTVGVFGQYDDNMVLKPSDEIAAAGITDDGSRVMNSSFRVNYVPPMEGPWLFNAQYSITSSLHQKHTHTHDSLSNTVSVTPGYNFGKYAINLPTSFTMSHVRQPNYDKYSNTLSTGPMLRLPIRNDQMLEFYGGWSRDKYDKPSLTPVDSRDADAFNASISWIWLFKADSFFNLKYQFVDKNSEGANFQHKGHRVSANLAIPLKEKVKLQLSGQLFAKEYDNMNTWYDVVRDDTTINMSGGLVWDFYKNANIVAQYTRIKNDSNIVIYDYKRNLYTVGLEYRF